MEPHRMKDYIRRCDEGCDPSAVDECGPRQQLPQVWSFAVKPKREFLAYVLLVTSEYVEKMPDPRGVDGGRRPHLLRPEGAPKRAVWVVEGGKGVTRPI